MLPICSQQHHAHAQDDTWALHAFRTVRGKGAALQNPPPVIAAIPARTPPTPPGRAVLLEQGGCTWGAHRGADPGCNGIQPTACKCTGQQMQRSASAPRCWQLQGRWGSCNAQRMQLLQGNLQGVRHCRAEVKHSDRAARPTANPNANCSTSSTYSNPAGTKLQRTQWQANPPQPLLSLQSARHGTVLHTPMHCTMLWMQLQHSL